MQKCTSRGTSLLCVYQCLKHKRTNGSNGAFFDKLTEASMLFARLFLLLLPPQSRGYTTLSMLHQLTCAILLISLDKFLLFQNMTSSHRCHPYFWCFSSAWLHSEWCKKGSNKTGFVLRKQLPVLRRTPHCGAVEHITVSPGQDFQYSFQFHLEAISKHFRIGTYKTNNLQIICGYGEQAGYAFE